MRNDIEGIVGGPDEGSRLEVSSLGDEVASCLYDALVDGRLPPGSRLSEAALARTFGISRGPIREALRLLERRRLLRFEAGRGSFVRALSAREVGELRLALAMINLGFRQRGRLVRSHDAVIAALLRRDADAAEEAMAAHLRSSRATLLARLEAPRDGAPLSG